MRNCLLVMLDPSFYQWLQDMTTRESFQETIALTDKALQERYDMELLLRFMIFAMLPVDEMQGIKDVGDFVTKRMRLIVADQEFSRQMVQTVFERTFDSLLQIFGSDCFRRQDGGRGRGGFLISMFEVLAMGIGFNLLPNSDIVIDEDRVRAGLAQLWDNADFRQYSRSGVSASSRIPRLIPLGRQLFRLQ